MLKFVYRLFGRLRNRLLYYGRYINWLGFRRGGLFLSANRIPGRVYKVKLPRVKTAVNVRCATSDIVVLEDTFLRGHYEFSLEDEPEVIVDAGAHIGLVTVLFANRYPDCRIIAIEPEPENFELLCANTEGYGNVTRVNAALWFERARLEIHNPGDENWEYRFSASNDGKVLALTVSQIMEDLKVNRIDLLKIDIEGAEKEVMEHSLDWIDSVGAVVIELHDRFREGCTRAFNDATQRFPCGLSCGPNTIVSMKELKGDLDGAKLK